MAESKTILIVDDDPVLLLLARDNLRYSGFQVLEATTGRQCIETCIQKKPDLIVLDVRMPGMDGWETCTQLKNNPLTRDIPVIFLTASAQEQDIGRGLKLGAIKFITKPFHPMDLVKAVEEALK